MDVTRPVTHIKHIHFVLMEIGYRDYYIEFNYLNSMILRCTMLHSWVRQTLKLFPASCDATASSLAPGTWPCREVPLHDLPGNAGTPLSSGAPRFDL